MENNLKVTALNETTIELLYIATAICVAKVSHAMIIFCQIYQILNIFELGNHL